MKHITYLAEKEITESFQDDVLDIRLEIKDIRRIIKIDTFLNLTYLCFHANKISKIEGLDKLVNLEIFYLSNNEITKIEGLNNLTNLHCLGLSENQITKIS